MQSRNCELIYTPRVLAAEEGNVGQTGMYVATLILFLIPSSILWLAWRRTFNTRNPPTRQDWRSRCLEAGLIIATFATLTTIGFDLSWTHNGGSPHGMIPRPGLWMILRPIALWCVAEWMVEKSSSRQLSQNEIGGDNPCYRHLS